MKTLFLVLIFGAIINTSGYAQPIPNIRFIHIGEETKPIGTLVISVGEVVRPSDRPLDSMFGKNIVTDETTFKFVVRFVKNSRYAMDTSAASKDTVLAYKMVGPEGVLLYLNSKNSLPFFDELRATLRKHNLDAAVIKILDGYY